LPQATEGDYEKMMENYEPLMSFGEDTAEIYDIEPDTSHQSDTLATVSFLEQLARGGPALELAIGTGRVALPLAARGIRVDGIDFSTPMVARLRAKPGGDQISVTIGNFADVAIQGTYRLIYVVFNTLFNLLTQTRSVVSRMSPPISLMTVRLWWRPLCRPPSPACATINTWIRKPSQSTRSGSMWVATTP
jgi:hypothetical protein